MMNAQDDRCPYCGEQRAESQKASCQDTYPFFQDTYPFFDDERGIIPNSTSHPREEWTDGIIPISKEEG